MMSLAGVAAILIGGMTGQIVPESLAVPSVKTVDGGTFALGGRTATVLVFLTHQCPIANDYQPTLVKIAKDFSKQGVAMLGVHIDPTLAAADAKAHAKEYGVTYPMMVDRTHDLVKQYRPKVTPEAVVLNAKGKVMYQGRINDLYPEIGVRRKEAKSHDLRDALGAVVAGKPVKNPRTEAIGCLIPDLSDFGS